MRRIHAVVLLLFLFVAFISCGSDPLVEPETLTQLESEDPLVRRVAIRSLENEDEAVLPLLIEVLQTDSDTGVRLQVIRTLSTIGEGALPVVLAVTSDELAIVRRQAATALAEFTSQPEDVVAALMDLLDDPDASVREAAASSLGSHANSASEALPALAMLLADPVFRVRMSAERAMVQIDPEFEPGLILVDLLEHKESDIRLKAISALYRVNVPVSAIPLLVAQLENEDSGNYAAKALVSMGGKAVNEIVELIQSEARMGVRLRGLEILGDMGQDAKQAIPYLEIEFKKEESLAFQNGVIRALTGIGTEQAVQVLLGFFDHLNEFVNIIVARNLREIDYDFTANLSEISGAEREAIILNSEQKLTFFVSSEGSDQWSGLKASADREGTDGPFKTIQKAVDQAQMGDTVYIREGIYREPITIKLEEMRTDDKLRISAYPGETVVLSGTVPISGEWSIYRDNIYKIEVERNYENIFVDGEMMIPARWPNLTNESGQEIWQFLHPEGWAVMQEGSEYGKIVEPALCNQEMDWSGGKINLIHDWLHWSDVDVLSSGDDVIEYEKRLGRFVEGTYRAHNPNVWSERGFYYLHGKLGALDSEREWFLDEKTKTLYMWFPDNGKPDQHQIEGSVHNHILRNHGPISNVELSDLHFFGTSFDFTNAHNLLLQDLHFRYLPERARLFGNGNTIKNSSLKYALHTGVVIEGTNNTIENNLLSDMLVLAMRIRGHEEEGTNHIRNNTFYNLGDNALTVRGKATYEYNHIFNTGFLLGEVAAIQTWSPDGAGSVISHNWVHDVRPREPWKIGIGIRIDDQGRGYTLHNNVVWNTVYGIVVKGENNAIYSNSSFANQYSDLVVMSRPEPYKEWQPEMWPLVDEQNTETPVANNLAPVITEGTRRSIGEPGGIHMNNYRSNDFQLNDPRNFDFRPGEDSPLIDAGKIIPGLIEDYSGKAPDIGAYEFGKEYWIPGATNSLRLTAERTNEGNRITIGVSLGMPPLEPVELNVEQLTPNMELKTQETISFDQESWHQPQFITLEQKEGRSDGQVELLFSDKYLGNSLVVVELADELPLNQKFSFDRPMLLREIEHFRNEID